MRTYLMFALFTLVFYSANTQSVGYLDSLKKFLANERSDTSRVLLLAELSKWSIFSNPDTSLLLARQGSSLAQRINYAKGEAYCQNSLGFFFWSIGEYSTAIKLGLTGLRNAQSSNNSDLQSWIYTLLENAYRDNGDYAEALKYDEKLRSEYGSTNHSLRASIFFSMNRLDSAKHDMELTRQQGELDGWENMLLGRIHQKAGDRDSAFHNYDLSIRLLSEQNNLKDLASAYKNMAALYRDIGNVDSAIRTAKEGLAITLRKNFAKERFELSVLLAGLYEQRNTDSSLLYYKQAMVAKDSLFSQEKAKQILSFGFNEELRQREGRAALIKYQNQLRIYVMLAALVLVLVIAFMLWRNIRHKQKAYELLHRQKNETERAYDQLKATQQQLILREKMASLGELTAGIAHEIQNPLNFVNNFSETNKELVEELEAEARNGNVQEVLAIAADLKANEEKVNHHGKRADSIVKGMLQHARASTGKKEAININQLADEYLRLSYQGMRAKDKSFNASLQTSYDDSVGNINVVTQDIGRVLLNLYNNAFYAVNKKKELLNGTFEPIISVATKREGDHVIISVKDNGTGMSEQVVNKAFQPFFTTKPTGDGTGLGLSLSYDIVTKGHRGTFSVHSREGEGSEFVVTLPTGSI